MVASYANKSNVGQVVYPYDARIDSHVHIYIYICIYKKYIHIGQFSLKPQVEFTCAEFATYEVINRKSLETYTNIHRLWELRKTLGSYFDDLFNVSDYILLDARPPPNIEQVNEV